MEWHDSPWAEGSYWKVLGYRLWQATQFWWGLWCPWGSCQEVAPEKEHNESWSCHVCWSKLWRRRYWWRLLHNPIKHKREHEIYSADLCRIQINKSGLYYLHGSRISEFCIERFYDLTSDPKLYSPWAAYSSAIFLTMYISGLNACKCLEIHWRWFFGRIHCCLRSLVFSCCLCHDWPNDQSKFDKQLNPIYLLPAGDLFSDLQSEDQPIAHC